MKCCPCLKTPSCPSLSAEYIKRHISMFDMFNNSDKSANPRAVYIKRHISMFDMFNNSNKSANPRDEVL